jgi:hypothetical protein
MSAGSAAGFTGSLESESEQPIATMQNIVQQIAITNLKNNFFIIFLKYAALQFNFLYKFLSNKKFFDKRSGEAERPRIWPCQIFHLP